MGLRNLYGRAPGSPCRDRGIGGSGLYSECDAEDYASWYDLAIAERRLLVPAFLKMPEGVSRARLQAWLEEWANKGAAAMWKLAARVGVEPAGDMRWPDPENLSIFDADDISLSNLELLYTKETKGLADYVERGNSFLLDLGISNAEIDKARKREAPDDGGILGDVEIDVSGWGPIAAVVAVGVLAWLKWGGR